MIDQEDTNAYGNELKFGYVYGMNQMETGVIPMYVPLADRDLSGLPVSRKRSRDSCSFDPSVLSFPDVQFVDQSELNNQKGIFTFLGQDISMQIYEQQLEIDRFISQHTEKMRLEIESSRRRISMRLIAFAEEGMKRLKSKEDEIVKIGRLNCALQQKVKSLAIDNQIWQQRAQSNEATATVLRHNLQQILTEIQQQQQFDAGKTDGAAVDDVESCCGSNYDEQRKARIWNGGNDGETNSDNNGRRLNRWCRNCGKEELCVLLLPCRHLCVCSVCESSINVCPICKSTKNASVHVNMNSF